MAKRFTDTDKWKNKFIRKLDSSYKLLWLYILDECNHAGVWIVDFDVAKIRLNENVDENIALDLFSGKIFTIEDGEKWVILDFIEFQYGQLNEKNRAHQAVISVLKNHKLWDEDDRKIINLNFEEKNKENNKPLTRPLQGAKDKDKDKDKDKEKDKEKDKDKDKDKNANLILNEMPFSESFISSFKHFLEMRNKIKKPLTKRGQELILKKLEELAPDSEVLKIKILEQSILNCWQGVFPLKENQIISKTQTIINEHEELSRKIELKFGDELPSCEL